MSFSWQANEYPTLLLEQQRGTFVDILGGVLPACCQLPDCNRFRVVKSPSSQQTSVPSKGWKRLPHSSVEAFGNDVRLQRHPSALPFPRVWEPRSKTARRLTLQLMWRSRVSLCLRSPGERAEPEQATLTGETLTWYSTKDRPSHQSPGRQEADRNRKEEHSGDK